MSPRFGTCGHRWASTAEGNASTSQKATGSQPSGSHATDAASMPLNSDRYLIRVSFRPRRGHAFKARRLVVAHGLHKLHAPPAAAIAAASELFAFAARARLLLFLVAHFAAPSTFAPQFGQ